MDRPKRVQLSIPMDNYSELLGDVKNYCTVNKLSLTSFVAEAIEKSLTEKLTKPLVVKEDKAGMVQCDTEGSQWHRNLLSRLEACERSLTELQRVRNETQQQRHDGDNIVKKLENDVSQLKARLDKLNI